MTLSPRQAVLAFVTLFLAIGAFGCVMSMNADPEESPNRAVIDKDATSEVTESVSRALSGILSYDFADPSTSQKIADNVLEGDARKEYDTLVASLHKKAPKQQLVLSAQVQATAVKSLEGDEAELLVFLDQTSQRANDKDASVSAAQLSVSAHRVDGAWRITGLNPL